MPNLDDINIINSSNSSNSETQSPAVDIFNLIPKEPRGYILDRLNYEERKIVRSINKTWKNRWEEWQQGNDGWEKRLRNEFPFSYEIILENYNHTSSTTNNNNAERKIDWREDYKKAFHEEYEGLTKDQIRIFRIAKKGDIKALAKEKIDDDLLFKCFDRNTYTVINWLVLKNHKEILKHIYNGFATGVDKTFIAAALGQIDAIKTYTNPIAMRNSVGATMLHIAAFYGQLELITYLIESKADINASDKDHKRPLHAAASKGYFEIVQLLLQHNATVDGLDTNAAINHVFTPLYYAVHNNHIKVVNLLLEHGANINYFCDENRKTALYAAVSNRRLGMVKLLLENQAGIQRLNESDASPIHLAAKNGDLVIVRLLCEKGANINERNTFLGTPLHYAVANNHIQLVEFLLKNGAELESRSSQGNRTPLHYAAELGHIEIVKLLLQSKVNIDPESKEGTPLALAALNDHAEIVKLLLIKGAKIKWNWTVHIPVSLKISNTTRVITPSKAIAAIFDFEYKFRNMLLPLTTLPPKSFLPHFISSPFKKSDMWKDLKDAMQNLKNSNPKLFENRLIDFFQNPKEWLALDDMKFRQFCRIVLETQNENSDLTSLAKEFSEKGLVESQPSQPNSQQELNNNHPLPLNNNTVETLSVLNNGM